MPKVDTRQIKGLIRFWEGKLTDSGFLLSPDTRVLIGETVKALQELVILKGTQ